MKKILSSPTLIVCILLSIISIVSFNFYISNLEDELEKIILGQNLKIANIKINRLESLISKLALKQGNILGVSEIEQENIIKDFFEVIRVVDGDTIIVDIDGVNETIRLIGIDTPETVDPRKPVECFGIEAGNKAKELLSGKWIELESDQTQGERGKYGRLLRYARTEDGLFYNLEIIKQGYAYEYTYNTPYKYQNEFKQAQDYAKINKLGLWADGICEQEPFLPPPPSRDCYCSSNKYNCSDFGTHAEAQALYECCGGVSNDIHRLDRDKDSSACESLP